MSGFLEQLRAKVAAAVISHDGDAEPPSLDDNIALGVLLWEVAQADRKYLPEESSQIEQIVRRYGGVSDEDIPVVMASIETAARDSIDLYQFTRDVTQELSYTDRAAIVRQLFRVACSDGELAHEEEETIRKLSGLCGVDHADFIAAKVAVKKECGL